MRTRLLLIVALVALAGAGLAFTKQGRAVLAHVGLAKACGSSDGCDN